MRMYHARLKPDEMVELLKNNYGITVDCEVPDGYGGKKVLDVGVEIDVNDKLTIIRYHDDYNDWSEINEMSKIDCKIWISEKTDDILYTYNMFIDEVL